VVVVEERVKEMANNRKRSVLVLLFLCSIVERSVIDRKLSGGK
jgi:hypothetical protein